MLTQNLGHVTFRCGAVFFTQPGYQLNAQCNVHCRPHVCELTPLRATVRGEFTNLLLSLVFCRNRMGTWPGVTYHWLIVKGLG